VRRLPRGFGSRLRALASRPRNLEAFRELSKTLDGRPMLLLRTGLNSRILSQSRRNGSTLILFSNSYVTYSVFGSLVVPTFNFGATVNFLFGATSLPRELSHYTSNILVELPGCDVGAAFPGYALVWNCCRFGGLQPLLHFCAFF